MRARLERHYETDGCADPLVIDLPKGNYVPQFTFRRSNAAEEIVVAPRVAAWRGWAAIVAVLGAAVAALAAWSLTPGAASPALAPLVTVDVELKHAGVIGSEVGTDMALSADGSRLVFVSTQPNGIQTLNLRRLDRDGIVQLPGTEGARAPFISPDGRWAGFWASGAVRKVPLDGGSPVILCPATDLLGASWGEDGTIVLALHPTRKLWRVNEAGGTPQALFDEPTSAGFPLWPQILPGGRFVLYTQNGNSGADQASVVVRPLDGGAPTVLVRDGSFGRYLRNGYITYVNQGTLYAVRYDIDRQALTGAPVPMLDDIAYSRTFGFAQMTMSSAGTLVYRRGQSGGCFVVSWLLRSGKTEPLIDKPGRYDWIRLSPDGQRLAFVASQSGSQETWIYDVRGKELRSIGSGFGSGAVLWWPDSRILLTGNADSMAWRALDGSEDAHPFSEGPGPQVPWSVSRDGTRLYYYEMNPDTGFDVMSISVRASGGRLTFGSPVPVLKTASYELYPSISPDGRWLAYASRESGIWEVYVRAVPDNGTKVNVSGGFGSVPRWSPNGRELLFISGERRIMAAAYRISGGEFVASRAVPWSTHVLGDTGVLPNFDLTADGDRLLALLPANAGDQQTPNHVTMVLNFGDEVRRRSRY